MEVKSAVSDLNTVDPKFLGQLFVEAIYTLQGNDIVSIVACLTDGGIFHFFKTTLSDRNLLDVVWVHSTRDAASAIGAISFCVAT